MTPAPLVEAATLAGWIVDGDELALLDAREEGVFLNGHLFHAACVALSNLELQLPSVVPRRSARIVWCDDGESGLANKAAKRSADLGWTNVWLLEGGTAAWEAAGYEIYAGINVPSKAFGEFVEHTYDTPRVPADQLHQMMTDGIDMVILDSRPMREYTNMSIPTGVDCPGAELVHRVKEMAPSSETLVVVNCAGRTRSIIGAQSLINAGIENQVVALENGTMGWELAGFDAATGFTDHAPNPSKAGGVWARAAAAKVGERFGVQTIDRRTFATWQADTGRTTMLFDVRTPEEYLAGHLPGSVSAPGGQLVQSTDEYVATRNARLVLVDDTGVRATMTASWLRQLGWDDAVVLGDGIGDEVSMLVTGPVSRISVPKVSLISVAELAALLQEAPESLAVLDVGTSLKYRRRGHIPGAWWGVRSRLQEARSAIGDVGTLVLTSTDSQLAKLTVAEAEVLWPDSEVVALAGGNKGWRHADHEMEPGFTRPTTEPTDVWYKPYDHEGEVADKMQDYLTWELALVDKLDHDPLVSFPTFPPHS